MTESLEDRISRARAHLEETRAAVARVERDLGGATATVRSSDRSVEVTIGAQGELAGLKFLDNKYLNMTGTQVASAIMEAAGKGRQEIAQRVIDTFEPLTRPDPKAPGSRGIDIDWERIFGSALGGADRSDTGRPSDRLRDEIHDEDGDDIGGGRA